MKNDEYDSIINAGKIARQVVEYARSIAKKDMLLLDLAEKIESKINELGAKPAFPVNLSINEIAAHATPSPNDLSKAHGLLKIDIGVHINGNVADTALSVDLENNSENQLLIKSAESALNEATSIIKFNCTLRKIGSTIEKTIKKQGFQPIQNLSGHSIENWNLHAGITIPNYDSFQEEQIKEGLYAIEPFTTTGNGLVKNGKPSGIYAIEKQSNIRDNFSREVLKYIQENYKTLPFCARWLHKKYGSRIFIALRNLEQAGILHQYPQLIETGAGKVAQAEHTVLIKENEKIITTQ